ncbi:MAG: hypothetical protein DMG59_12760, partial [Acidobacteria bacterium]
MKQIVLLLSLGSATLVPVVHGQEKPRNMDHSVGVRPLTVVEAGIPEMRTAMEQGRITSRELVVQYLTRIALYEDQLHAAITVNPHALQEAEELDRE